ncbi:MAG: hypothetical protein DMG21_00390 [Acidobacteria bacterium]|nr:MAG: hypothetical protein DMG21_00390 [Acidobacteriota bacterium]
MICLLALAMLATVAARFVGAILRFLESDGLHRSPEIGHESPLPDRRAVMGTAPLPAGGGGAGAERRYNPLPLRLGFALTLLMLLAWAACGGGGGGGGVRSGGGGGNAGDFYVSTIGSDSTSCGAITSPCATIPYASSKAGSGMTVHVAAGQYSGSFQTSASGTSSAPLVYQAESSDFSAPVNCAQVAANHGLLSTCAQILSSSSTTTTWYDTGNYVVIKGFDVTGPSDGYAGINVSGTGAQVVGNNVHGARSSGCSSAGGAGIEPDGDNEVISGNYVHNSGPYPTHCDYIHGIYVSQGDVSGTVTGVVVENNISFDNSGWGIQLWHDASNEILVNNTLFNNVSGGIVVGASTSTDTGTIVNNNIVYNNCTGISEQGTTGTNTFTANLLFQNSFPPSLSCPTSLGDLSLQNGDTAAGTESVNPAFVNFTGDSTGNYHLTSLSLAAINRGTSSHAPSADFDGNARPGSDGKYDIGAYEFKGTVSGSVTPQSRQRPFGRPGLFADTWPGRDRSPWAHGHTPLQIIWLLALALLAVAARLTGAILRFLESDGLHRNSEIGHDPPLPDRRAAMRTWLRKQTSLLHHGVGECCDVPSPFDFRRS